MSTNTTYRASARLRYVVLAAMALAIMLASATSAYAFDPELVISNDNMRAANSMTESQIQAFLETQPGVLKDLVTRDYDKVITLSKKYDNKNLTPDKGEKPKRASRIIWEAARAWNISPKVLLTMLQKEQSLLTARSPSSKTLARAMGAGVPGGLVFPATNPVATNRYPGFGNQIWHSARLLDSYGETSNIVPKYYPGIVRWDIYRTPKVKLHMKNLATYKLYVYNPSIGGNTNFYNIYRRYFGSTFANPRFRPVYRFRNRYNGTYLYTASVAERVKLKGTRKWAYGGASFSWDTSMPVSATKPVWRFYNRDTKKYSFTADPKKYRYRRSARGNDTWKYGGVAFRVATPNRYTTGAKTVYRLKKRSTGGMLMTSSKTLVNKLKRSPSRWRYLGPGYYLPRYQSTNTTPTP